MITPSWLMLICGLGWLVGELWGVKRDARKGERRFNTTSDYVQWLCRKSWAARFLVAAFCLSLVGHFEFGWYLLP